MDKHIAYICIGSNMGNRLINCKSSITALTKSGTSVLMDQSKYYKTEPVDYENQNWFVNVVLKIESALDPFQLLINLKLIEQDAGRHNDSIRFGPRVLDLDIIMYDDLVIKSPLLTIPHPRMHKRRFVLKPVCDIDPMIIHPVLKKDMRYLLERMDDNEQKILPYQL